MHDLDRAMFETGEITGETGQAEQGEHAEQQEFLELLGELTGGSAEVDHFDRAAGEAELAVELLEVQGPGELDRFLSGLISRAVGAARNFARSGAGQALGGILKKAARDALPVLGRAAGGAVGPQYAAAGGRAGQAAGTMFGLELEGLTLEDREFEVAKAFVRFADAAARQAAKAPPGAPPQAVALTAATAAARRFAPGLVGALVPGGATGTRRPRGRWERRGENVVIFGV
jgi:hypothetical protein